MQNQDIFKVEINEDAVNSFQRIYKIVRLIFWLTIVVELLIALVASRNFFLYRDLSVEDDPAYYWGIRIYLTYSVIFLFLAFFQSFFFLKFAGKAKNSLKTGDSALFSKSLTWLYRSLYFGLTMVIFNGIYFVYSLFFER